MAYLTPKIRMIPDDVLSESFDLVSQILEDDIYKIKIKNMAKKRLKKSLYLSK